MSGEREEERPRAVHQGHSDKAYLTTKRGKKSQANKDGEKISPALTGLSSLLHDGEAFIYYFKEVEKIITTVIPHLMCPKPPITPWPAALSAEYRETRLSVCCHAKISPPRRGSAEVLITYKSEIF